MEVISSSNMSDKNIAEKMQRTNYEKFKTLVRMHLSFELDLNTDEFDLPCHEVVYYEKGKLKKWSRLSRKIKSCASGKSAPSPPKDNDLLLDSNFVRRLKQLKAFILLEKNVCQEGIFRKTGSVSRQNELRSLIQRDELLDLNSGYTVHDCAAVFKGFLADLHEPVLTDAHYPAHCQIAPLCSAAKKEPTGINDNNKENRTLSSMQLLLLLLPQDNRQLLQDIIEMLNVVATHEDSNKMSSDNLATLFAPHLICPRNLPPEGLHYVAQTMSAIISYMITRGLVIFEIPAKLATDIRAYFLERKRKKTMSPEQTLDESISDISTVNTVYTFLDREKTAAAHNANNTDTELAQLYAHIQSLPESSKKRRLIKQFNKQNGQGTPLQLVVMNQAKHSETSHSAKSISDSIKKRIFHKGIISRTPKRSTEPTITQGTPNYSIKTPKLRVLFQSPISNVSSTYNTSNTSSSLCASSSMFSIKMHPLKKSISSTSLLLTHSSKSRQDPMPQTTAAASLSTPVNRNISSENSRYFTPLKMERGSLIDENSSGTDINEKSKAIYDINVLNAAEPNKILSPKNQIEFQSRYKSEPNLSLILKERLKDETLSYKIKSRKHNLIKGVSMENLRFPDYTKNYSHSVSSNESITFQEETESEIRQEFDNEKNSREEVDFGNTVEVAGGSGTQRLSIYRNIDLITSTPSMLNRRSMSPITKSTQRMPKAMQESIMTPRSRKPVVLTTTLGSSEPNQTLYQSDLSSFREQDEDSIIMDQNLVKSTSIPNKLSPENVSTSQHTAGQGEALSNNFKDYLLGRSVLTASPVDSSFSSQPDDFSYTRNIEDLEGTQLSSSLLYCLDGNQPIDFDEKKDNSNQKCLNSKPVCRKRVAENKENYVEEVDSFLLSKKIFISDYDENPGETSF